MPTIAPETTRNNDLMAQDAHSTVDELLGKAHHLAQALTDDGATVTLTVTLDVRDTDTEQAAISVPATAYLDPEGQWWSSRDAWIAAD